MCDESFSFNTKIIINFNFFNFFNVDFSIVIINFNFINLFNVDFSIIIIFLINIINVIIRSYLISFNIIIIVN